MSYLQKVLRVPNLVIGAVTALFNMLNILGVYNLSADQLASVNLFLGAVFALVTAVVTPSNEVIAQQKPGEPVKATGTAEDRWGIAKDAVVHVQEAA